MDFLILVVVGPACWSSCFTSCGYCLLTVFETRVNEVGQPRIQENIWLTAGSSFKGTLFGTILPMKFLGSEKGPLKTGPT